MRGRKNHHRVSRDVRYGGEVRRGRTGRDMVKRGKADRTKGRCATAPEWAEWIQSEARVIKAESNGSSLESRGDWRCVAKGEGRRMRSGRAGWSRRRPRHTNSSKNDTA